MLMANAVGAVHGTRPLFMSLDMRVCQGELWSIIGGNGVGKTTLLRILTGLSRPYQGEVLWHNRDIGHCREDYHGCLLYIGHGTGLKKELTVRQALRLYCSARGQQGRRCIEQALEQIGLAGYSHRVVAELSAGQQRRVALTRLWLTQATVWILDEPLAALDQGGIKLVLQRLSQHCQQGGMGVVSTHQPLTGIEGVTPLLLA